MIVLALLACGPSRPRHEVLQTVTDAPNSGAQELTFSAVIQPDFSGRIDDRMDYSSREKTLTFMVYPLMGEGDELPGTEVPAWLLWGNLGRDAELRPFLAKAIQTFDGQHVVRLNTMGRSPGAGWFDAIRDAEKRHGLRSHPDAPVLTMVPRAITMQDVIHGRD